ncbi:MAG: hypothetical protein FWD69_19425 [Polyangiaceae bacterium]|nr:hypothetical protein [Polyangiaceae bacterium]
MKFSYLSGVILGALAAAVVGCGNQGSAEKTCESVGDCTNLSTTAVSVDTEAALIEAIANVAFSSANETWQASLLLVTCSSGASKRAPSCARNKEGSRKLIQ